MVKSQDKVYIISNIVKGDDLPPKIPPRMKKNGPALPEKPPHIKAKSALSQMVRNQQEPSQIPREPLKPRVHNVVESGAQREVLVAASRAARERPVEKRQREPAKLLMPTFGGGSSGASKKEVKRSDERTVKKLDYPQLKSDGSSQKNHESQRKSSRPAAPVLLIPRGFLTSWTPVSYALWTQRDGPRGPRLEPGPKPPGHQNSSRARSSSVARSGSLTSQGSSSSDSGNETFPKSVLKKQKRGACPTKGGSCSGPRKGDQKKNVTFNAFATVQLMEE